MEAASIPCRYCENLIGREDINQQARIAHCPNCDALFSISSSDIAAPNQPPRSSLRIPVPVNVEVEHQKDALLIRYSMWGPSARNMVIFALFWNLFMIGWIVAAILIDSMVMILVSAIHTLVGLYVGWLAMVYVFNRTEVTVTAGDIEVRQGPIPVPGNPRHFERRGIEQLYCIEKLAYRQNGIPKYIYPVMLRHKGGKVSTLIYNVPNMEQSLYLEQQVEKLWGIRDLHVPGEVR